MPTNTKETEGRRTLRFESLDEVIADAEVLRAHGYERLGNWSLGQVCDHLARAMNMSIDGIEFRVPWVFRLVARGLRGRMLRNGLPAGLPLKGAAAKGLKPADQVNDADGVEALHRAVARLKTEPTRNPSPVFGTLTAQQWDQFHRRHAELHLSFLKPAPKSAPDTADAAMQ